MATKPLTLLTQLVALALLVGGVAAFGSFDKTVRLSVDGQVRTVDTYAQSVGAVLDREGVTVGVHDDVTPSLDASIDDGTEIVVVHGRPIELVLDGSPVVVWVTAGTVEEALEELGLAHRRAYVSASPSHAVPISGIGLTVRTPKQVRIVDDGEVVKLHTSAATIRAALAEAGVRLGKRDRVSARLSAMPRDGQVIRITRIDHDRETTTTLIPYNTVRIADSSMYRGRVVVTHSGRNGVLQRTWRLVLVNGEVAKRQLLDRKLVQTPHRRVVRFGTKPRPIDELNWSALAYCESGNNPRAYSPAGPYYGLYQFSLSSWQSVGGSGDPRDASPSEQTYRAQLLYKRQGAGAWPTCGQRLYD